MEKFINYYEILEVSKDASQEEIKKAYLMMALKYHPDTSREKNAEEMMKNINIAYSVLSDDKKRKMYDLELQNQTRAKEQKDETSNYNPHERYMAERLAVKEIILTELQKNDMILQSKKNIMLDGYSGKYSEDAYYDIVEEWINIANEYVHNLLSLAKKAFKYNLYEEEAKIFKVSIKTSNEIESIPTKLTDDISFLEKEFLRAKVDDKINQTTIKANKLIENWERFYFEVEEKKCKHDVAFNNIYLLKNSLENMSGELYTLILTMKKLEIEDEDNYVHEIFNKIITLYDCSSKIIDREDELDDVIESGGFILYKMNRISSIVINHPYNKRIVFACEQVNDLFRMYKQNLKELGFIKNNDFVIPNINSDKIEKKELRRLEKYFANFDYSSLKNLYLLLEDNYHIYNCNMYNNYLSSKDELRKLTHKNIYFFIVVERINEKLRCLINPEYEKVVDRKEAKIKKLDSFVSSYNCSSLLKYSKNH